MFISRLQGEVMRIMLNSETGRYYREIVDREGERERIKKLITLNRQFSRDL